LYTLKSKHASSILLHLPAYWAGRCSMAFIFALILLKTTYCSGTLPSITFWLATNVCSILNFWKSLPSKINPQNVDASSVTALSLISQPL
jgi:hypothetical protein